VPAEQAGAPPPDVHRHDRTSDRGSPAASWLSAGIAVGLVGGALAGLVEPLIRMGGLGHLMTARLWIATLSFSLISHMAAWSVVCVVVCAVGLLTASMTRRWAVRFDPGLFATAAFLVGLGVAVAWGEGADRKLSLFKGMFGRIGAITVFLVLLIPATWACERFRRAAFARLVSSTVRVAVWPALVLLVCSVVIQWRWSPGVRSSEGFWPPAVRPIRSPAGTPPNIVLLVFDTLRADRLGCNGYARPVSPHIDAFAADAVRFTRAYSPGIWTPPSHASLFTGLYGSQHGVNFGHMWLDKRFVTLAELLRDHGYQTVALSNNPLVSPKTNLVQGFEHYKDTYQLTYTTGNTLYLFVKRVLLSDAPLGSLLGRWFLREAGGRVVAPLVDRWLAEQPRPAPFLLFVNYMEPHLPREPTRAYRRAFVRPEDLAHSYRIDQSARAVFQYTLNGAPVYTPRDLRILSDLYDARVRELDDCFADLMDVLAGRVDLDNTIVILTSDHGENLGEHGMLEHQFCIYNTLIHVPLIVRWPKVLRPQVVDRLVQTNDLFATLLAWTGAEMKQFGPVLAPSLAAVLSEPSGNEERYGFSEYLKVPVLALEMVRQLDPTFDPTRWKVGYQAVIDRRWKLISRTDRRVELYDLQRDPGEQHDVADVHRAETTRLERELERWSGSFKPFDPNQAARPQPVGEEHRRRLRDLGYIQ